MKRPRNESKRQGAKQTNSNNSQMMMLSPSTGKEGQIRWFWILKSNIFFFFIVILWETAKDFTSQQWKMEYRLRNMWRVRAKAQAGVPWEHGFGMAPSNEVLSP